ncbi:ParB-like nuclease domain protein [Mycobacterium phage Indlovu]|nr:ParB-like nuclease domain protein [Mycobacterium phage Indlovu]
MASTSTVGKTTNVPPSTLNTFHRNPRQGDIPAIMASLRRHNQYKPITVNLGTHTGRPNEVLAGNHTLLAIRELAEADPEDTRWRKVIAFWVDVDDDMAERIVVADNQTGQLGGFDEAELAELVAGFGEDIEGLGFTEADIADLKALHEEGQTDLPPFTSPFDERGNGSTGESGPRDDGLVNAKDMTQRRDEYAENAGSRMVVLSMPINLFVWVQDQLAAVRKAEGVETNTDAVIRLLEAYSGTSAPAPEETTTDGADEFDRFPADPEGFDDAGD